MVTQTPFQHSGESFLRILEHLKDHAAFSQTCGISAVLCQSAPHAVTDEPGLLEMLQQQIDGCQRCALHAGRTQIVFGRGHPQADLMLIGEGPDELEDRHGIPFVGPSGELLTKILDAIQIDRDEVYITHIVKCRPPGNRDPEVDEIAACAPFLQQQIACVQPKIICALGECAAQALLQSEASLSQLRGRFYDYGESRGEIRVMPTYHPVYLLQYPEHKRAVWQDMQHVQQAYRDRVSSTEAGA